MSEKNLTTEDLIEGLKSGEYRLERGAGEVSIVPATSAIEGEVLYADQSLARMKQFVKELNRKIALGLFSLEVEPEIVDLDNPVRVRRLK